MRECSLAAELMRCFGLEDPAGGIRQDYWDEICDAEWVRAPN